LVTAIFVIAASDGPTEGRAGIGDGLPALLSGYGRQPRLVEPAVFG
jgi:hypothetical protein